MDHNATQEEAVQILCTTLQRGNLSPHPTVLRSCACTVSAGNNNVAGLWLNALAVQSGTTPTVSELQEKS